MGIFELRLGLSLVVGYYGADRPIAIVTTLIDSKFLCRECRQSSLQRRRRSTAALSAWRCSTTHGLSLEMALVDHYAFRFFLLLLLLGGVDLSGLKPSPQDLSSFSALTLLVGFFDPVKPVPDMTYNVFGATLNLAQLQLPPAAQKRRSGTVRYRYQHGVDGRRVERAGRSTTSRGPSTALLSSVVVVVAS